MRGIRLLGFTMLTALVASPAAAKTPDGWEYIGTDSNVTLYRKNVEGSDMFAFRGITYADVHIGKLYEVLRDPDQRADWVDRYEDGGTLKMMDDGQEYWIHFGLPWPVADRDYVLRSKSKLLPDRRTLVVNINSFEHPKRPPNDCCVRALAKRTYYEFTAIPGEERTKLVVEVHTDPRGSLPSWLVNIIQKKWPSKTLSGLIAQTKKSNPKPNVAMKDWHDKSVAAAEPAPEPTTPEAPETEATPEAEAPEGESTP
ncbi:MAG: START domain-containing protein [Deltaproteobacteria bacterium]